MIKVTNIFILFYLFEYFHIHAFFLHHLILSNDLLVFLGNSFVVWSPNKTSLLSALNHVNF